MAGANWVRRIKINTEEAGLHQLPANRSFLFGLIALALILALAYWNWRHMHEAAARVAESDRMLGQVASVISSIKDAETGQRGYLLTGHPRYLETYRRGSDAVPGEMQRLRQLTGGRLELKPRLDELTNVVQLKIDELRHTIELRQAGRTEDALAIVRSDHGKAYMDRIRVLCDGLSADLRKEWRERTDDASLETTRGILLSTAASGALFLLLLLATLNLNKQKLAAETANQAKSAFLANMSHELRTPLNAIIGYSEMILEDSEASGEQTDVADVKKIRAAGKHLLDLINAVLDISKIEAGKMELYLETFSVATMVQETVALVEPLAAKNGNEMHAQVQPGLGLMRADQTKVRQSLFNLLSNACKFTEHGSITLTVKREPNEMMSFAVADTGMGITPEQMSRIFVPFTQADTSTSRKFGGTGLGLVISRRFAELMGGEITVASQIGKGSTFTLRLPQNVVPPQTSDAVEVNTSESSAVATVLAIDDDPEVHELLRRSLVRHGLRVESARSGEEGLRLARKLRPRVITLDVMMPGMDGWTVLSSLKSDPELSGIPVVMLTIADSRNLGYALGAADYLTKPIDRDRLAAVLLRYRTDSVGVALVVEDDEGSRDMLSRLLEGEGWQVDRAANGRFALDAMRQRTPSVILLDLMMPEMDGFEFLDQMHRNAAWRGIPVIVITAKDLSNAERERLQGQVGKVLQKGGYERDELLRRVSDMVSSYLRPVS